jgi:hypothetical protein
MTYLPERTVEEGRTTSDAFEPPQSRDRADHVDLIEEGTGRASIEDRVLLFEIYSRLRESVEREWDPQYQQLGRWWPR